MFKKYNSLDYLAIDIANNFDSKLEKQNFENRIEWFNENKNNLHKLLDQAENKALYYAGIEAYKDYLNNKPSGYLISLDACASGIQILSALSNCKKSAQLCGLDNNNRVDVYTLMHEKLNVGTLTEREPVKKAIMTYFYSSTAQPKKVFGDNVDKFYQLMQNDLHGPYVLKENLELLWNNKNLEHSFILPDGFNVILPVMEKITEKFMFNNEPMEIIRKVNKPSNNHRSLVANIIHSIDGFVVREMQRRCNFDPVKINNFINISCKNTKNISTTRVIDTKLIELWELYKSTGILSLRIINYIDKNNIGIVDIKPIYSLIKSLPKNSFELISIHDCFKCLPNYGNDLRQQYNNILASFCDSNLLQHIARTLLNDPNCTINKSNISLKTNILNTNYSLS